MGYKELQYFERGAIGFNYCVDFLLREQATPPPLILIRYLIARIASILRRAAA